MNRAIGFIGIIFMVGCAHVPAGPGARADLVNDARRTLAHMEYRNPEIKQIVADAPAYVVFPVVGDGGFLIGGGAGAGVLFENGEPTGFADVTHTSVGALAGGQRYSQLVVIKDRETLRKIRSGRLDVTAGASAIIVESGAAVNTSFRHGVAIFIAPRGGAMVNASVTGERITLRF